MTGQPSRRSQLNVLLGSATQRPLAAIYTDPDPDPQVVFGNIRFGPIGYTTGVYSSTTE